MSAVNVASITKWRHANRELWRDMETSRRISATKTIFSVCDPDQAKIRRDMTVNLGMVMLHSTGLPAVMPPHVIRLVEMNKYKITTNG